MNIGYIYILTNPAMPGLVKIGHTARDPQTRAAELSAATGVPGRFVVAWAHPVCDHEALEGLAHGRLNRYRVNAHREFFSCTVTQARRIIEQEARAQLLPWWRVMLHRLVHPLPARTRPAWRPGPNPGRRRKQGDLFNFYTLSWRGSLVIGLVIHYQAGDAHLDAGIHHLGRLCPGTAAPVAGRQAISGLAPALRCSGR